MSILQEAIENALQVSFKPQKDLTINAWSEEHVYLPAGTSAIPGRFKSLPYQRAVFEAAEDPKISKISLMWGAQLGKALCVKTPIPTPCGWKTMGDLSAGDKVYDENGLECNVTFVTETMHDRECYRIGFSDGASVVADAEHMWPVSPFSDVKLIKSQILKTHEMFKNNSAMYVGRRQVSLIKQTESVPVKCIQVDSPNHLYLCTRWHIPTHNTQLINNIIGYYIQHEPQSQMVMQPTRSDVKTWLETKFNPMCEYSKSLTECIAKPRGREGVNNQDMKSYRGGYLMMSWAGSPNTMRGRSAPRIYADECDGYNRNSEGHPVNLLWQRAATFGGKRKLILTSTPTFKGTSFIELSFNQGDQRKYWIPCPHCGEFQTLKWSNVTWKSERGEHFPETATYVCDHCACEINDGQKIAANRKGEWRASMPFRGHASFHLSELYSPFRKWEDIVQSFLEKKSTGDLKTFVNVSLGETWEEAGEQNDPQHLLSRVEDFNDVVPYNGAIIVAGIDVQLDRLELQGIAFGAQEEAFVIDYKIFRGDPNNEAVWQDLSEFLDQKRYKHECGKLLPISFAALDTGFMASKCYEYVRTRPIGLPFAVKGKSTGGDYPFVSAPTRKRVPNKAPFDLYSVGVDEGKSLLYNRIRQDADAETKMMHFCEKTCDENYFGQLTAERRVLRYTKGFPRYEWHNVAPDKRNEALDTFVYALAVLRITNIDLAVRHAQLTAQSKPKRAKRKTYQL
jgi:phage terminase large subunit GpA-like protein